MTFPISLSKAWPPLLLFHWHTNALWKICLNNSDYITFILHNSVKWEYLVVYSINFQLSAYCKADQNDKWLSAYSKIEERKAIEAIRHLPDIWAEHTYINFIMENWREYSTISIVPAILHSQLSMSLEWISEKIWV